jgi:putative ABC transport system substrate-binding protein
MGLSLARAQQLSSSTIGFLSTRSGDETQNSIVAFRDGLKETGFVEGRNLTIEYRWASGRQELLPLYAAELVRRQVALIATAGGPQSALAAKAAANRTPIVFIGGTDPVALGLVQSLSRPGGNVTGVLNIAAELSAKRLEILRELVPGASTIAVMLNPGNVEAPFQTQEIESAARRIGSSLSSRRSVRRVNSSRSLHRSCNSGPWRCSSLTIPISLLNASS